jgi:hypothetical protein
VVNWIVFCDRRLHRTHTSNAWFDVFVIINHHTCTYDCCSWNQTNQDIKIDVRMHLDVLNVFQFMNKLIRCLAETLFSVLLFLFKITS